MLHALPVAALIVLDQVVAALVRADIPLYTAQPLLPGFWSGSIVPLWFYRRKE